MTIDDIPWTHPCGCGDTPHPRAEVRYAGGWLRVKDVGDGNFEVQKFGVDKMRDGDVLMMSASDLAQLIA